MGLWWSIFIVKMTGLESLRKRISPYICGNVSTLGEGNLGTEPKYGWYHSKGYGLTRDDIGRHIIFLLPASWPQRPYAQLLHRCAHSLWWTVGQDTPFHPELFPTGHFVTATNKQIQQSLWLARSWCPRGRVEKTPCEHLSPAQF